MGNARLEKSVGLNSIVIVCLVVGCLFASEKPRAVPTFHCVGLCWNAEEGSAENACRVRYRKADGEKWKEAMGLWFDRRKWSPVGRDGRGDETKSKWEYGGQYRGSIVNLKPGTEYEVELFLEKTGAKQLLNTKTWSEDFPVAKRVDITNTNQTLGIAEGGSSAGYVLYTYPEVRREVVIDVANKREHCVEVRASYVIVRGLTLKGAQVHGIRIFEGCHDVVIEDCDISGWGRVSEDGWGRNLDTAVYSRARDLKRVIVQQNRIHHPRGDSSNWKEYRPRPGKREPYHSEGPQAVYFRDSEGNHVIRYNTVFSDDGHQYNDIFGAGANFSIRGFPNRDSDIYGNWLSYCWDDAIESEGANCNVRIWGNYTTDCFVSIATAGTSVGPLYVWRNVSGRMRVAPGNWTGGFLKSSDIMGGGKIFVFHNTILQPSKKTKNGKISVGASIGLGWGGPMVNVTSRNNILNVKSMAFRDRNNDESNDYDYDLYRGTLPEGKVHERHGIVGEPVYDESNGGGTYALAKGSAGFDAGVRIPNFNDYFTGEGPDMGAHETGTSPMEFGATAYNLTNVQKEPIPEKVPLTSKIPPAVNDQHWPQICEGYYVRWLDRIWNTRKRDKLWEVGETGTLGQRNGTATYLGEDKINSGVVEFEVKFDPGYLVPKGGGKHFLEIMSWVGDRFDRQVIQAHPHSRIELANLGDRPRCLIWNYGPHFQGRATKIFPIGSPFQPDRWYHIRFDWSYHEPMGEINLHIDKRVFSATFEFVPGTVGPGRFFLFGHVETLQPKGFLYFRNFSVGSRK